MVRLTTIIFLILFGDLAKAQVDVVSIANKTVDVNQERIDKYDGQLNDSVLLLSPLQSNQATNLYIKTVDEIQKNINNNINYSELEKKSRLGDLTRMLEKVDKSNFHLYTSFQPYFQLIIRIQEIIEVDRIKAILKSDLLTTLNVIPFFDNKAYALDILILSSTQYPSEVLKKYSDFAFQPYAADVLEELCKTAPAHVSYYMGSPNPVFTHMYEVTGKPIVASMMEIYHKVGSNSKAYLFLDDIVNVKMSIDEAHQLGKNKEATFTHLLALRTKNPILGGYSVDDELTFLSSRKVREINDLHEASDVVRFQLCDTSNMSAQELYTLIVYGENEVYTSTFLGLFKRLMSRMTEESSYEFLHSLGRNKYRTFIKMCAAYNELPTFLSKMTLWEKRALFNNFIAGLETEINPLQQAVAVADTYGSIVDDETKSIFETALRKEYGQVKWKNNEAEKLYGLLLELLHINPESQSLVDDLTGLSTMDNKSLIKNAEHIQQHFFFDDEDGWASYATFVARFQRPGWKLMDKGHYVIIESTAGKKVKIYANKAKDEYDGQEELQALFENSKRFPDVVVHRGHSYYANITIASITPNSDLVILGSCGGYNNISKVLDYSPNAQIISSKQVGTLYVNNELIFAICETIRLGKDLAWEVLWPQIELRIKGNSQAVDRFQDYLPPHMNLGAILIRNYRRSL